MYDRETFLALDRAIDTGLGVFAGLIAGDIVIYILFKFWALAEEYDLHISIFIIVSLLIVMFTFVLANIID